MKVIFMGTPDSSAEVLQKLNGVYPVCAAVTGLDKPVGRGYKLQPSALKQKAEELNIPVLQYEKVSRDGIEEISALEPDVIVTAAFGQILSERFLAIPKYGVLNVHASLLPKYRGSSPIQWAVLNGEKETGVTIMRTVKAVDAGDILLTKATPIGEKETAGELFDRLAVIGGEAIVEAIGMLERGEAKFVPQDSEQATHCSMISKADGKIDFTRRCCELDCFVRGMTPWPSAFCGYNGKTLKIYGIEKVNDKVSAQCGSVVCADAKDGLVVQAGDGQIRLCQIQLEGAKRMSDTEFLRGRSIRIGTVLC